MFIYFSEYDFRLIRLEDFIQFVTLCRYKNEIVHYCL